MLFIFEFALANKCNNEHAELGNLKDVLEKKAEDRTRELKNANDQKPQFLINLAHETRTPLTLITNHLDEFHNTRGPTEHIDIGVTTWKN